MFEIIGVITEIVSNQYYLLVLIQKVIAPQRLFDFCCHGANHFSLNSMAEKGKNHEYKTAVLLTYSLNISRVIRALRKKIDLKGKILQGLSSEKFRQNQRKSVLQAQHSCHRKNLFRCFHRGLEWE